MRILVVDDEPDLRECLTMMLESKGHEVVQAKDGVEGVFIFRKSETPFDVVISDYKMPRMNGIDMLTDIRKLEPAQRLVLQTASIGLEPLLKTAGLDDVPVLWKPWSMKDLFAVIGD